MDNSKVRELLNLVGSIASITGVSLLWLKDLAPQGKLAYAVPIFFVASLVAVGFIAFEYLVFDFLYGVLVRGNAIPPEQPSFAAKIAYTGLAGGVLIAISAVLVGGLFAMSWEFVQAIPQMFGFQQ